MAWSHDPDKKRLLRRLLARKRNNDARAGHGSLDPGGPGVRAALQTQVTSARANVERAMEARKLELENTALQALAAREKIRAALKARKEELKNNVMNNSLRRGRLRRR